MSSRSATASLAVLALAPLAVATGALEFEDLTPGTEYPNGSSFITEGAQVNVTDFFFSNGTPHSGGSAFVVNPSFPGSGNAMSMGNVNLDFQFPFPLTIIGFAYANFGGNVNMSVNNVLFNDDDLSLADGMNIGGANVSYSTFSRGLTPSGIITIQGNITQFSVGGQEFEIDDVRYIPTPAPAALLALGALPLARRRRR